MESANDYKYYRLLHRYCAMLCDGHSDLRPRTMSIVTTFFDKRVLILSNIEGKAFFTQINNKQKEVIPIGSKIAEVNRIPTWEYIEKEVLPYIPASTDYVRRDKAVEHMFQSLKGISYQIKFVTPAGKITDMTIIHAFIPEIQNDKLYPLLNKGIC